MKSFLQEAYGHGKAVAALENAGAATLSAMGISGDASMGVYQGSAATVATDVLLALAGPVRFPQRFPTDDPSICL